MLRQIARGAVAGAAGTVALNVVTYVDMTARGRAPSQMPAQTAGALAEKLGIHALDVPANGSADAPEAQAARHRASGAGALMGYATGLGIGVAYGLAHPWLRSVPAPLVALALGAAAMAAADTPMTALGLTNPLRWSAPSWLEDVLPHALYGAVVVLADQALRA